MIMRRWKASGDYLKPSWCIIEDSKHGNKPFRRLSNSSKSSITDSASKKNQDIYCLHNFHSNTMPICLPLKPMDSIFDRTLQYFFCQINAYRCNLHVGRSSRFGRLYCTTTLALRCPLGSWASIPLFLFRY